MKYLSHLLVLISLGAFSCKNDKDAQAQEAIKEYLELNLNDPSTYEPVYFGSIITYTNQINPSYHIEHKYRIKLNSSNKILIRADFALDSTLSVIGVRYNNNNSQVFLDENNRPIKSIQYTMNNKESMAYYILKERHDIKNDMPAHEAKNVIKKLTTLKTNDSILLSILDDEKINRIKYDSIYIRYEVFNKSLLSNKYKFRKVYNQLIREDVTVPVDYDTFVEHIFQNNRLYKLHKHATDMHWNVSKDFNTFKQDLIRINNKKIGPHISREIYDLCRKSNSGFKVSYEDFMNDMQDDSNIESLHNYLSKRYSDIPDLKTFKTEIRNDLY